MKELNFRNFIKNKTKLKLYSLESHKYLMRIKSHNFCFNKNQSFDNYLFLKEKYNPDLYLMTEDPQSKYYKDCFKINGVPVVYDDCSFDEFMETDTIIIAVDLEGKTNFLRYSCVASGFGYEGIVEEIKNKEFYLTKEEAEEALKKINKMILEKAMGELLNKYPAIKEMYHIEKIF